MHRFRVRSKSQSEGSKRSGSEAPPPTTTMTPKLEPLPPESDFRTSLIMPSLSRRFTLLRGQNGEPLSIDDVRTRLAHQRATGHVNHVTEEEEEIMIDALIRAHSIDPTASPSDSDGYTTATANDGYSTANTNTNDSYSGYDSSHSYGGYARNMTANPPKRKVTLSSASAREMLDVPKQGDSGISFGTYLSGSFSPAQVRRASLALQDAIQEYEEEEEEDEKILAPRKGDQQREHDLHAGDSPVGCGEAIAWPNDQSKHTPHDPLGSTVAIPYHPSGTSSPNYRIDTVNRLPGYVPGMHRPITPRDSGVDTDTNTGTSTPQPTSNTSTPGYEYGSNISSPGRTERALPQSILINKRASTTNSPLRTRPRELSNPDQYDGGGSSSDTTTTQAPLKSALSDKRRPTSPLVDSAYQSAIRAGTPSNHFMETWSPSGVSFATHSPPHAANSNSVRTSHMRETSNASSGIESSDTYFSNQSQSRSAASPALPDSPTVNGNSGLANIVSSWSGATTNVIVDEPVHRTSTPRLSTLENGHSSRGVRPYSPHMRAGTPNANARRSGHSRNGSLADTTISPGRRSPRSSHAQSSTSTTRLNPLMMSPMLNSSRSSLASTGSSYHSWDEDKLSGKKPHKRGVSVFIDSDSGPWKKHQSGFDVDLGTENAPAPGHIRDVLAGLTVQDMIAVQNKLVSVAVKKRVSVPGVRPLSGPRRRRASAGQSVTSLASPTEPEAASPTRVASPPPVTQTQPPNPIFTPTPPSTPPVTKSAEDQAKKANALLHAMMDSIESSPHKPTTPPVTAPSSVPSPSPQPQALAPQTSFSSEEPQSTTPPSPQDEPPTPDTPIPDQDQRQKALADALFGSDSDATVKDPNPGFGRSQSLRAFAMPPVSSSPTTDPDASPVIQGKSVQDEKSLAEDVERRAMAATAALKSASTPRLDATTGRKAGKKVNPRQISSPQLVSATTSVDTIGLAAAAAAVGSNPSTPQQASQPSLPNTQSKLSQRIKKFTGNLRTRAPIPTAEDISPYVIEVSTPPSGEPAQTSAGNRIPSASTTTTSRVPSNSEPKSAPPTTESPVGAPSTPDGSAPSSAGTPTSPQPRLRGFMARLRKGRKDSTSSGFGDKPRAPSPLGPNLTKPIPAPPHIPAAMLKLAPIPMPENLSTSSLAGSGTGIEVPPPPPPPPTVPQSAPADLTTTPTHTPAPSQQVDEEAIRRLYDAASQLGLDHSAINDILVRSQSTSSRSTGWTQASSPMAQSSHKTDTVAAPPLPTVLERSMSVTTPKAPRSPGALGRQLSLKPYNGLPLRTPASQEDTSSTSIIRRTVIFPTPPGRASSEMNRRPSSSRHKRNRSGSIHSNKSVQDRTPTPPPSRAPLNKRFSKDASPPVPQLPTGIEGSATSVLLASRSGSAFSNNYDSFYDIYAENSLPDSEDQPPLGSAVEVLELSDGQIVWSVVDGLRSVDDDFEGDDLFPRISRTSEFSAHETHQLRFREHQRSASKTSTASKVSNDATPKRPETRVYFSNAGDIGTLIDSLTKSHEAGQFSIIPGVPGSLGQLRPVSGSLSPPSQSGALSVQSGSISANSFNSSYLSDADLTLEERLEQMIISSRKRTGL
ncbi:unnamed protein product [Rhizoctonia solani]|uniref:Uncharacterized protein n=1 Tax=Rhizoctonia solani TaxID=456999 RepID=A0A8H3DAQ4_9AGAM|nr:unnamed protein product [Rhizoctonia solani]